MSDLAPGDRITVSVSHQVYIKGDQAWVKVEVQSAVGLNESGEDAYDRVNKMVQDKVIKSIESTVETVMSYEEKQ